MGLTSAERVRSALLHKEPDRIPLDIGGTRISGIHLEAYTEYRRRLGLDDTESGMQIRYLRLPKIDEDFRALIGADIESADPYTAAEETADAGNEMGTGYTDRWGCRWTMPFGGHYYDLTGYPLAEAEAPSDLKKIRWPAEDSPLIHQNIGKDADIITNVHKRALFLGRTCPGIYEMLCVLCGYGKALTDLACNPKLSEAIMDKVLEMKLIYYEEAIKRIAKTGAEYFIIGESDDLGTQNGLIMSPAMYREMVKPRHGELFRSIKKLSGGRAYIELHTCGAVGSLIPDLIESGVEILNPVQVSAKGMDDTKKLKKDFGDDITFHGGGIDSQYTLPYGTCEEVRDEVKKRISDLAPGGGFIFTPVHSIQHDVPFENFMAMIETFEECVKK